MVNVSIRVKMEESDFKELVLEHCSWDLLSRPEYIDDFEPIHPSKLNVAAVSQWEIAYFVGSSKNNMLLARGYLNAIGESCQVLWNTKAHRFQGFFVLTNYRADGLPRYPQFTMPGEGRRIPRP